MLQCPKCDTPLISNDDGYECPECEFILNKQIKGEQYEIAVYDISDEHSAYLGIGAIYPGLSLDDD